MIRKLFQFFLPLAITSFYSRILRDADHRVDIALDVKKASFSSIPLYKIPKFTYITFSYENLILCSLSVFLVSQTILLKLLCAIVYIFNFSQLSASQNTAGICKTLLLRKCD